MSTEPQLSYTKVRILFALSYSHEEADTYTEEVAADVAAFADFLSPWGEGVVKAFNPDVKLLKHFNTVPDEQLAAFLGGTAPSGGVFFGEAVYDVPVPPPFGLDDELRFSRNSVAFGMVVLLRRIFYMPAATPRIDSLGYFAYWVQYWDGSAWADARALGGGASGGGAKM